MLFRDSQKLSNFGQTFSNSCFQYHKNLPPPLSPLGSGAERTGWVIPIPHSLFTIHLTKSLHRQGARLLPRLLQLSVNLSELVILLCQHRLQRLQFNLIALFASLPGFL